MEYSRRVSSLALQVLLHGPRLQAWILSVQPYSHPEGIGFKTRSSRKAKHGIKAGKIGGNWNCRISSLSQWLPHLDLLEQCTLTHPEVLYTISLF